LNTQATDWHVVPKGDKGTCSVCGCRLYTNAGDPRHIGKMQHRAINGGWEKRKKTRAGWECRVIGPPRKPSLVPKPKAEPKRRVRPGAKVDTRRLIGLAAALRVQGFTGAEIAERLGVSEGTLGQWKCNYPDLWDLAYNEAMRGVVDVVRAQVGTDAILADPDKYIALATQADQWLVRRGEQLFPRNGKPTLTTFFEDYYLPNCLFEATKGTIEQYRYGLIRWRLLTGDPALGEISVPLLAKFRDALLKMAGAHSYQRMRPTTVCSKLRIIHTLLGKAAKPGPRNRDALGLIDEAPWVRPPKCQRTPRTIVTDEQIEAVYLAAASMDFPRLPGIKPPGWWKAFITTTWCTGLRFGTLMELRMTDLDWGAKQFNIPAERMKSRRDHISPLTDTAIDHLRKIRTDREYVFPWPIGRREFYKYLHKLQDLACIPKAKHFGTHAIRRTLATRLYEVNPAAAQLALGHMGLEITREHYVKPEGIVRRGIEAIPQPPAFTGGPAT